MNKNGIVYKLVKPIFVLMTAVAFLLLAVVYYNTSNMINEQAKKSLDTLNKSIFLTLRNAMNTGDSNIIKSTEADIKKIKGIKRAEVEKGLKLIQLFGLDDSLTQDKVVLSVMQTRKSKLVESGDEIRLLTPLIAKQECLQCHVNQKEGEVIGVIDLTYSLAEVYRDKDILIAIIFLIFTVVGWFAIAYLYRVVKKTMRPLEHLKDAIAELVHSSVEKELEMESNDEIGEVVVNFNNYMKKLKQNRKQDEEVVAEAKEIINLVKSGFYHEKIKKSSSSEIIDSLKESINDMIEDMDYKMKLISMVLARYGSGDYNFRIDSVESSGAIKSIMLSLNAMGNNSSELLATILVTGKELSNNIDTLKSTASRLSKASSSQATSLQEFTVSIKNITRTIQGNITKIDNMLKISDELIESSEYGKNYANKTAKSMDEINEKINLISEAVDIIENISFQTKILSLNAAVEAATAGEAGKGFAVVAAEVRNLAAKSSEAAEKIKKLVSFAIEKAYEGKSISSDMINGYDSLIKKINQTKEVINEVATESKNSSKSIEEMSHSAELIDKEIEENVAQIENIEHMASKIDTLSKNLMSVKDYIHIDEQYLKGLCDIEFSFNVNKLQLGHIKFKDNYWDKESLKKAPSVTQHTKCALGKWILESEQKEKEYTKKDSWRRLKQSHIDVHDGVQKFIDIYNSTNNDRELIDTAKHVEKNIGTVFGTLNEIKRESCQQ